jgi:nicotinamide riboside kinase
MRIAFTGPESSGKTTLSKWLSTVLENSEYIPEFARDYLEGKKIFRATEEDFKHIVKKQCSLLGQTRTGNFQIFDTDLFVLRIWNEEVFKLKLPELELNAAISMDIHFLCSPDVEWEDDPLRSAPEESERQRLFNKYKTELICHQARSVILFGTLDEKKNQILQSLGSFPINPLKR